MVWGMGSNSFFCLWIFSCPCTICCKDCVLFQLNGLGIFVENELTINVKAYFWTLNSVPLICVYPYASTTLSWLLLLCSKFWNWAVWVFQLYSCFARLFWLFWVPWIYFHVNFRISLSISAEKVAGTL